MKAGKDSVINAVFFNKSVGQSSVTTSPRLGMPFQKAIPTETYIPIDIACPSREGPCRCHPSRCTSAHALKSEPIQRSPRQRHKRIRK